MVDEQKGSGGSEEVQSSQHEAVHHSSHHSSSSSEELSIDFGAVKRFVSSLASKKWLWVLLAVLIPVIISIVVRLPPLDQPFTENWAENVILNQFRSQTADQVRQQYPHLSSERVSTMVEEKLQQALKEQGGTFNEQKKILSERFREQISYEQDGVSYPYMPDIDPYHYLRYARNILDTGVVSDSVAPNGQLLDKHMLAPVGKSIDLLLHPFVIAWNHRVFSLFGSFPLPFTAGFVSVWISALAVIPAFFIGRRYGGALVGFFSALFVAISPALVGRSMWGRADTDVYNSFFPLLIVWLFLEAVYAKKLWSRLVLGGLAGLSVGLYAFAWSGWWYVFDFGLFALGVGVVISLIFWWMKRDASDRRRIVELCSVGGMFVLFTMIGTGLFVGNFFSPVLSAMFAPLDFSQNIKVASHLNLWPNVYTTVAELNPGSMRTLVDQVTGTDVGFVRGGMVLLALAGIVLAGFHSKREKAYDAILVALLAVWFFGTAYATLKGVRFIFLLAPAFSLAFGIGAGKLLVILSNSARKAAGIRTSWTLLAGSLLVLFFLWTPYQNALAIASNDVPIMNDGWWDALSKIREETSKDAIITSWWDFGHHFKYVADRRVTFDGASQNQPQAYWVGKALLTSDEREAVGILKMLDCGANTAFELVEEEIGSLQAHEVMDAIVLLDRPDAEALLKRFNVSSVEKVLSLTHCNPPEGIVITSDDMIGKGGVWGHFGSWDHRRAYAWTVLRSEPLSTALTELKSLFNLSDAEARRWYAEMQSLNSEDGANAWIAPWPGFLDVVDCSVVDDTAKCGAASVNLSTGIGILPTQSGTQRLAAVSMIRNGSFETVRASGEVLDAAVALIPDDGSLRAVFVHEKQAGSMFMRLFYFGGHGLKYFDFFDDRGQVTGGSIKTWTIDWNGTSPNNVSAYRVKDSVMSGDQVSVFYIGAFENGTLFDSAIPGWQLSNVSLSTNFDDVTATPFTFKAGQGMVINGFDNAVLGMKVGDEKTVTIPPARAYGVDPNAHPLGNKTLVFKIRVVQIR